MEDFGEYRKVTFNPSLQYNGVKYAVNTAARDLREGLAKVSVATLSALRNLLPAPHVVVKGVKDEDVEVLGDILINSADKMPLKVNYVFTSAEKSVVDSLIDRLKSSGKNIDVRTREIQPEEISPRGDHFSEFVLKTFYFKSFENLKKSDCEKDVVHMKYKGDINETTAHELSEWIAEHHHTLKVLRLCANRLPKIIEDPLRASLSRVNGSLKVRLGRREVGKTTIVVE